MRRSILALATCWVCVAAAADGPNLLGNPGFEISEGDGVAWTQHYRKTVDFEFDASVAHAGKHSARCRLAASKDRTGVSQRLNLNQEQAVPMLVSLWYRTDGVTGPVHRSFALVLAIEYTTDLRKDKMDDAIIVPFEPGTHGWQELTKVFVPQASIRYVHVHCEMKGRRGTAWFDDVVLAELSETPVIGPADELAAWSWGDVPGEFAHGLRAPEDEAFVLLVQQLRTQDYHQDALRLLVSNKVRARGKAGELASESVIEPISYVSQLAVHAPKPPYAHVCFQRWWEDRRLLIETQGASGSHVDYWLALPREMHVAHADLQEWEPSFDSLEAGALGGRVVLHVSTETASGRDRAQFTLRTERPPLLRPRRARIPEGALMVGTEDGLALHVGRDGRCAALTLDGRPLASGAVGDEGLAGEGGFYLGDLMVGAFEPVGGHIAADGEAITQRAELKQRSLRFRARYEAAGGYVLVSGAIEDTTGRDRALDLVFKLPMRADGWTWANALYETAIIEPDGQYEMADYPFAAVCDGEQHGVAMALLPDRPARASFAYRPSSALFHVRFKCGLTAAGTGELKSRYPFAFIIYRADGKWGWRDAIRRYHESFPEYFTPICPRHGKWLFQARPDKLPNPEQFAYDEGSYSFEVDDESGVGSYPYMIPAQREIKRLEEMPGSYEAAMAAFERYELDPARINEIKTQRGWGANLKEIITNCCATDPDGRYHLMIRSTPWGANSVTFFLNPDPDLFADQDRPVVGKHILDHVRSVMAASPSLDGIYLDSFTSWGTKVDNCRQDHMAYAAFPFAYDEGTGKVCIIGQYSALEFLQELRDLLHPTNRYILSNLGARLHPFTAIWMDLVGVEGGTRPGRAQVEQFRPVTGKKQLCILEHEQFFEKEDGQITRESYDDFAKRCLLWGAIPSVTYYDGYPELYNENQELFDLYNELAVRLSETGWQAVTYGETDSPDVWVEGFAPEQDGTMLFTVFNTAQEAREVEVRLDSDGTAGGLRARRLVGGGEVRGSPFRLSLPGRGLEVLEVRRAE